MEWEQLQRCVPGVPCCLLKVGRLFVGVERGNGWSGREDESVVDWESESRFDWRFVVVDHWDLVVVVTSPLLQYWLNDYHHCHLIVVVEMKTFMFFEFECASLFKGVFKRVQKLIFDKNDVKVGDLYYKDCYRW